MNGLRITLDPRWLAALAALAFVLVTAAPTAAQPGGDQDGDTDIDTDDIAIIVAARNTPTGPCS